ncbi:hypothetical protein AK812_SmicGene38785 [Symbiodinium microadriaticum]|uniref:Uncharacterized protein n=1 Tax=Symbiodinium microadriaticum TaxID=2951 RepID=A0A1Q9CCW4_SYMMI|nr:hypothetical protein AK812_SmicGene38785 [Symbiodinium microadriaticum]
MLLLTNIAAPILLLLPPPVLLPLPSSCFSEQTPSLWSNPGHHHSIIISRSSSSSNSSIFDVIVTTVIIIIIIIIIIRITIIVVVIIINIIMSFIGPAMILVIVIVIISTGIIIGIIIIAISITIITNTITILIIVPEEASDEDGGLDPGLKKLLGVREQPAKTPKDAMEIIETASVALEIEDDKRAAVKVSQDAGQIQKLLDEVRTVLDPSSALREVKQSQNASDAFGAEGSDLSVGVRSLQWKTLLNTFDKLQPSLKALRDCLESLGRDLERDRSEHTERAERERRSVPAAPAAIDLSGDQAGSQ